MKRAKRTYGKTSSTKSTQRAVELFDEAMKDTFCAAVSGKKVVGLADQFRGKETLNVIHNNHKAWDQEVKETSDNTSQHSTFMIFDSYRIEKTEKRKPKAQKKSVLTKGKRKEKAESKNRKVKVNQKAQDSSSLSSPADNQENTSSLSSGFVVEEVHKPHEGNQKRTQAEGVPDDNANFHSSSDVKKPKERGHQQRAKKKGKTCKEKPVLEKKKRANRESSTSHSSHSSIEAARRSKDHTVISGHALPSSPVIDILKDDFISSEEDVGHISSNRRRFECHGEESDTGNQNDQKGPPTRDTSGWFTVSSQTTQGEEVMSVDKLLQSPEVKVRQYNIMNSTANTAGDNISQLPFPSALSPITQQAEFTPHKGSQEKRRTPSLPGKKLKTSFKKESNVPKCSTKLFTSSLMNCDHEEIPDVTRISYTTCIRNDPNLLPPPSSTVKHKVSSKKDKGPLEFSSDKYSNPPPFEVENTCEHKKELTNLSSRKFNRHKGGKRNMVEQKSDTLDNNNNNDNQELKNVTLKKQEDLMNNTNKVCSTILTGPASNKKPLSSSKQTVHWCNSTTENKKRNSSAGVSCRERVQTRSILKRSNETNCNEELSPPLKKYSKSKPIRDYPYEKFTKKDLKKMIGDSSICFINRLYMKSQL